MYTHDTTKVDWDCLSQRELQVVYWMIRGYSNEAIGSRMFIESISAERHVTSIYGKLDLRADRKGGYSARAALTWLALRDGVLTSLGEDGVFSDEVNHMYGLTRQERLIADLFGLGHSVAKVAETMRLSPTTIWWKYQIILLKCGINGQYGRNWKAKRDALAEVLETT